MTAPAHPRRCDTCEYYQEDDGVCENPIFLNQGIALILGEERYGLIYEVGCASHSSVQSSDIEQLKKAIIEVLDTGFESSERDMELVLDRIDAWEKGELRSTQRQEAQ